MMGRSSLSVGFALVTMGLVVGGCHRGGGVAPGAGGGSPASASASQDAGVTARKAACAAFRDAVASTNTANQTFLNAANDPKREGNQYDKPITDAVNAGAVIFMYASDQVEAAVTPQVPKDLASKLMDFVQILQERANLYAQHASSDDLDANGKKYTLAATGLLKQCPTGSADATPPKPSAVRVSDPDQVKKKFCDVYSKQIQNTEDAIDRFGAATKGDDRRPNPQWDDPDQWLTGQAQDSGVIFKYAANALEANISSSLQPELADKAKALVAAMRKLGELYADRKSTDAMKEAVHEANGYGPSADGLDKLCGIK